MFNYLSKLRLSIDDLTETDKKRVTNFSTKLSNLVKEGQFEESISLAKASLQQLKPYESVEIKSSFRHEVVKQINSYIVFLINEGSTTLIKQLFSECEEYIYYNIFSYLITMTNYSSYLLRINHPKQSKGLIEKVRNVHIVNYLTNSSKGMIEELGKVYSNLSCINNANRCFEEGIVNDMEALVLNQINLILNNTANDQLFLVYYSLGTQQESYKRLNDAQASFHKAKSYFEQMRQANREVKGYKGLSFPFIQNLKVIKDHHRLGHNLCPIKQEYY